MAILVFILIGPAVKGSNAGESFVLGETDPPTHNLVVPTSDSQRLGRLAQVAAPWSWPWHTRQSCWYGQFGRKHPRPGPFHTLHRPSPYFWQGSIPDLNSGRSGAEPRAPLP